MPLYQFDDGLHVTERRESMDVEFITCGCGRIATRVQVYRDQYMSCETGPKGGTKSEPPRDEKNYRRQYGEYREASSEMDYAYSRVDDPKVKAPNYYKRGVAEAKKQGAKVRT